VKTTFKNKSKEFSYIQKLGKFIISTLAPQELLEDAL
jgi:hypothetical protein